MPVLFLHGAYDTTCETMASRLAEPMRRDCADLTEVVVTGLDPRHEALEAAREIAGKNPEAMRAAKAIGDDALQRQATGHVVPDSFTHGTSEQRMRWFTKGYQSGDIRQGDTFQARDL